jgi:hypothetical protein
MTAIAFEIRVEGWVDPNSIEDLGEVAVSAASTSTVLTGEIIDQSALMGLLTRLRAHGFMILEVRRRADASGVVESSDSAASTQESAP